MGFSDAIKKITAQRDYSAEITELQAKLQAAQTEIAELQAKNTSLQHENKKLHAHLSALEQSNPDKAQALFYKIQNITKNFNEKLASQQKFASPDTVYLNERYNYLFILLDDFCIPMFEALETPEISTRLKMISKSLKSDAPEIYAGRIMNIALSDNGLELNDPNFDMEQYVSNIFTKINGSASDKSQILTTYAPSLRAARYSRALVNHIQTKFDEKKRRLQNITPDNLSAFNKEFLEMIIEIGILALSLTNNFKNQEIYAASNLGNILGTPKDPQKEFRHRDPAYSGLTSNTVYELLLDLSKKYNIDLSQMSVLINGKYICDQQPQQINTPDIIKHQTQNPGK